jgi:putative spermidine/putrescine transport system permease protein
MVPPITYGIPLATMLYEYGLAGRLIGVIVANLAPAFPFVIVIMIPFIEQIDPNLERSARMLGASPLRVFTRVLLPLAIPGVLAAGLLVLVRTIAMFELTFLTAGATTQTLVVSLYYATFAAGIRPTQSIDAMAVIYMATTTLLLVLALRFINPVQLVSRVKR